ncbi:hypothetical protein MASR1M46_17190 [Bacteroidales bacterium]
MQFKYDRPFYKNRDVVYIKDNKELGGDMRLAEPDWELIWTSRPGAFEKNFTILPIEEYIDSPHLFKKKEEWFKMKNEYSRLKDDRKKNNY